ncbi:MAG: LacI family DNA-binding transcriptional regulator [Desulfobacteraceae bacterium]|jgi:DNA-binding LacI/PurR family transcriptional regulator
MVKSVNTLSDIAKLAGVSKSTVSRALNNSSLISKKTREHIQAIAREHNFATHQVARCLSLKRSHTIGLIVPIHKNKYINDPFLVELLGGILFGTAEYGYDLLIGQPQENDPGRVQYYIDSKRADGLILLGCKGYLRTVTDTFQLQYPIIVWDAAEDLVYCSVNSNNVVGGRLAVAHLLEVGCWQIAFLGGPKDTPEVRLRYQGYAEMLRESGRESNPALVVYGDYTSRSGYENMQEILHRVPSVDGVFACSDFKAIGAMEAIREKGRHVPDEIAVVGFDDVSLAAHCSPPLTTIRQNILQAGKTLVRNLMQYLEDNIITKTILPVELVVRKSSDLNA